MRDHGTRLPSFQSATSLRHFRKLLYGDMEPNELNEANETIKIEIISDINLNDDSSITN